jgi:hypothetical protein
VPVLPGLSPAVPGDVDGDTVVKSEYAEWLAELNPPRRLTIAERVAKWFDRPKPDPEPFVWRSVDELFPESDQ